MKRIGLFLTVIGIIGVGSFGLYKIGRHQAKLPPLDFVVQAPQPPAETHQTPAEQQKLFSDNQLDKIQLPTGFSLSIFAKVPDARSLTVSPSGVVFVSNRVQSNVYALTDQDKDGFADQVQVVAKGLDTPNGVAVKDGDLYIATINSILKLADIENHLSDPPKPEVVFSGYPSDKTHGWKFIAFGPDGKLYVPVGAPCNSCVKENVRYASLTRLDVVTKQMEVIASGIRNTVGFAWHPDSGQLWFTDNGRDSLGDDKPTDELNLITGLGQNFGFPYCHQGDLQDPVISPGRPCSSFVPPVRKLSPHAAALGMRFYTGQMFPAEYQKQIFIAEHGSWNRTEPIGYRVMLVRADANGTVSSYQPFADGWLQSDGKVLGRPVDVAVWTDGSLLVSDDKAGLVYRISYKK